MARSIEEIGDDKIDQLAQSGWVVWPDRKIDGIFWLHGPDAEVGTRQFSAEGYLRHDNIGRANEDTLSQAGIEQVARYMEGKWVDRLAFLAGLATLTDIADKATG